jgi:hypothetical protein
MTPLSRLELMKNSSSSLYANEYVNWIFDLGFLSKIIKKAKIEASSREKESNSSFIISTNATNAPFTSSYQGSNNKIFTKDYNPNASKKGWKRGWGRTIQKYRKA